MALKIRKDNDIIIEFCNDSVSKYYCPISTVCFKTGGAKSSSTVFIRKYRFWRFILGSLFCFVFVYTISGRYFTKLILYNNISLWYLSSHLVLLDYSLFDNLARCSGLPGSDVNSSSVYKRTKSLNTLVVV